MKYLPTLILLLFFCRIFSQPLTVEQIRTDIDTVISVLSDIHPTFNESPQKLALTAFRDSTDKPESCHELFKQLQPLVALDGHTTLQFTGIILPEPEGRLLPFESIIYDNRLYIKTNLSTDTLLKQGTEIFRINGKQVAEILSNILPCIPGERLAYKTRKLDNGGFPNWYRLIYGNFESFDIDFLGPYGVQSTLVEGVQRDQFPRHEKEMLKLSFPESNIGYLEVGGFRQPKAFLSFIDSAFTEVNNRQIKHLIIDITEGGGFSMLTDSLLSYITEKPFCDYEKKMIRISRESKEYIEEVRKDGEQKGEYFVLEKNPAPHVQKSNQFTGKVYILVGPRTYSASSMFAAMSKCYTDAVLVGEETGQPLISNGDISRHKLPISGMNLYASHSIYCFPCAENNKDGVRPDIEVKLSVEDLLQERNKYLEYALGYIKGETGKCPDALGDPPAKILKGHNWSVTSLDISHDGTFLISGGWDNTMILWDVTNDSIVHKFNDHSNMIWDVAFSPDERYVASASWDASINLWDIESKELVLKLIQDQKFRRTQTEPFYQDRLAPNMVNSIAFHPDGSMLASGSSDGKIRIWNISSGDLTEVIDIHDSLSVNNLLFNSSGTKLISSSDKIKIYNLKDREVEMILDGHRGQLIGAMDIADSCSILISGDIAVRNPLIVLWDLRTGNQIREIQGHRKVIRDIAFSNDDSMFVSVGEDNLIRVWSVNDGDSIATFTDHDNKELNAVCFDRDDKMIIYGSQDKTIKFRSIEKYLE